MCFVSHGVRCCTVYTHSVPYSMLCVSNVRALCSNSDLRDETGMDLGTAVRKLREKTGDSQQAFANRLGLSIRAIVNYERDRTPAPKALVAMAYLAASYRQVPLVYKFVNALPPEIQRLFYQPFLVKLSDIEKVIAESNPIPGSRELGLELSLSDLHLTLRRCANKLDSLILGNDPDVSGQPAKTIRNVVEDLRKVTKSFGNRSERSQKYRGFGPASPKTTERNHQSKQK
jgi:transcriptional regulator with XRE-family HTH domain